MTLDVHQALRFAADQAYQVSAKLGLHPHTVTIVTIVTSGVDIFGNGGTRVRTNTSLTIGDGYTQADGYINPALEQVKANDIFLSGGLLTDKDFRVGPIVYPYTFNGLSGGTDISLTNPALIAGAKQQLFFFIQGPSFPNGAYFRRKWSREDSNLSYYLYLENSAEVPAP